MGGEVFLFEEKRYTESDREIYPALRALAEEERNSGARYRVEDHIIEKRRRDDYFLVECGDGEPYVKSKFVGFLYYQDKVYVSLPKYVREDTEERERLQIYRDICRLLYRFRNTYTNWLLSPSAFQDMTREMEAAERLGELYQRNGLYTVPRANYNTASGRVLWGRTAAKHVPDLYGEAPVYLRLERRTRGGEENEISELQKALLYFLFEERGYRFILPRYPVMEKSVLSWEEIRENEDFFASLLREERQTVFDDDRIDLLETMLDLLCGRAYGGREGRCAAYGVARFEDIFEKILGECLKNQITIDKVEEAGIAGKITKVSLDSRLLGKKIEDINADTYEIIRWNYEGRKSGRSRRPRNAADRNRDISVPDIVCELPEQRACMLIDAKYYQIYSDDREMSGYPGRDSVLKQIHYKRLLETLYRSAPSRPVICNLFLLPDGRAEETAPMFRKSGWVDYPGEKIHLVHVNMTRLIRELLRGSTESSRLQRELWSVAAEEKTS